MKTLIALITVLFLSACSSHPDFSQMTPEQIEAYHAYQAERQARWSAVGQVISNGFQQQGAQSSQYQTTTCKPNIYGSISCSNF